MSKLLISTRLLKTFRLIVPTLILTVSVVIFSNCNSSTQGPITEVETGSTGINYQQSTPPPDIASEIGENASLTELAEFAWNEFIALNWPAVSNGRGAPDVSQTNGFITASKVGGPTYTPVWQTYWHRNELFPPDSIIPVKPSTTDPNPPKYQYSKTYEYVAGSGGDYTLWNNLDEINELGEDVVFAHSNANTAGIDSTYQVLYEAKMNFDGSNYIYTNKLYDKNHRDSLKTNTMDSISMNGICGADPTKYICLPCGSLSTDVQGNIEVKAGWRRLTADEASSNKFHTQEVIYYENISEGGEIKQVFNNATMGLVGLHIIHKTETFPDFVYATWEHVDNLKLDSDGKRLVYTEIQNTVFGDTAKTVDNILRVHPIPNSISSVNTTVNQYLSSQNSVWQNYKLINVQAKPRDVSTTRNVPETDTLNSDFYLSNSVIESNIELQTFTGSLTDSTANNVIYKGQKINMGGCMGCHGNAQKAGSDFNFLIAGAPFSTPEFTGIPEPGCPPGEAATTISYWNDVVNLLSTCAIETSINLSPHHYFWALPGKTDEENYCLFTTGDAYSGGPKICDPGHSDNSTIINYLANKIMPGGGGPYFTSEQVAALASWIDNNCPYDAAGTYHWSSDCKDGTVNEDD